MAYDEKVVAVPISRFGGLDTDSSIWTIDPRDTPDALNVYTEDGKIRKRPGLAKYNTTIVTSSGTAANDGLVWAAAWENNVFVIRSGPTGSGVRLLHSDGDTPGAAAAWTDDGALAAHRCGPLVRFGTRMVVHTTAPSSNFSRFTSAGVIADVAGPTGGSRAMDQFNNMLFWGRNDGTVAWSGIGTDSTYATADSIQASSSGAPVVGLKNLGRFLLAIQRGGLSAIRGFGSRTIRVDPLDQRRGCPIPVWPAGNNKFCYFIGNEFGESTSSGGVYLPDLNPLTAVFRVDYAGNVDNVSKKISKSDLFDDFTALGNQVPLFEGSHQRLFWHENREALFAILLGYESSTPSSGRSVWMYQEGSWHNWTLDSGHGLAWIGPGVFPDDILACGDRTNRYLYYFNPAQANDDGTTFSSYWTTPRMRLGQFGVSDDIQYLYVSGSKTSGDGFTFDYRTDDNTTWSTISPSAGSGSIDASGTGWALRESGVKIPLAKRCRLIQFRFTFATNAVEPTIDGIEIGFNAHGRET